MQASSETRELREAAAAAAFSQSPSNAN